MDHNVFLRQCRTGICPIPLGLPEYIIHRGFIQACKHGHVEPIMTIVLTYYGTLAWRRGKHQVSLSGLTAACKGKHMRVFQAFIDLDLIISTRVVVQIACSYGTLEMLQLALSRCYGATAIDLGCACKRKNYANVDHMISNGYVSYVRLAKVKPREIKVELIRRIFRLGETPPLELLDLHIQDIYTLVRENRQDGYVQRYFAENLPVVSIEGRHLLTTYIGTMNRVYDEIGKVTPPGYIDALLKWI